MTRFLQTPVAAEAHWMMQLGERFAFEGLLAQLRPRIAGGDRHLGGRQPTARHVHAFDINERAV